MHYKEYSTEDFIQDEFFQQWIYAPDDDKSRYWETFLMHYPEQRSKIEEATQFLRQMVFKRNMPDSLLHSMKTHINEAIDREETVRRENEAEKKKGLKAAGKKRSLRYYYWSAAVVAMMMCLAGYYFFNAEGIPGLAVSFSNEHYVTAKGSKLNVVLPDGTRVWLNAESRLRYAKAFNHAATREVYLEGEAFFDVTEDTTRQFVVNTCGLAIKVLGTVFNVRSYPSDKSIETTLVQGKVTIEPSHKRSGRPVTLIPNQKAVFTKDSKKIALEEQVNTEEDIAWKDGWIVFEDRPFYHIIETLERWYDVRITMEDRQSLTCTFSGKFKDKTLEEVLDIFMTTESIRYEIDGHDVSITGKLCEY